MIWVISWKCWSHNIDETSDTGNIVEMWKPQYRCKGAKKKLLQLKYRSENEFLQCSLQQVQSHCTPLCSKIHCSLRKAKRKCCWRSLKTVAFVRFWPINYKLSQRSLWIEKNAKFKDFYQFWPLEVMKFGVKLIKKKKNNSLKVLIH